MKPLLLLLAMLALVGCAQHNARKIVEAQTPGLATGAGATITGPANSAQASTQVAERRVTYQAAPAAPLALPRLAVEAPTVGAPQLPAPELPPPAIPAAVYERVETTIGAHQDAAGIVKVAVAMSRWSSVKWMGLLCIVIGILGMAWSYKNEESGYPLVYLKVSGVGVFLVMVADNPAWLLLLLVPLALYALQKFNLLRLP